jgi:integrase
MRPILSALRQFVKWAGNPIADRPVLWRVSDGDEDRRNWVDETQMAALFRAAVGRVRVRVVLQGFCGLRECGARSVRVSDLRLDPPNPCLNVREKGRHGGTWRRVPVPPTARAVLLDWIEGRQSAERIYPVAHAQADADLADLGRAVGLPFRLSGHVLRRSFGRIAYHAGVPIERIRRIYGHHSVEQTLHYIGVEVEAEAQDSERFDRHMAEYRRQLEQSAEA